jgi:sulfate adenylyltransferase
MRMAGPREAILHAIVRKNYGATHFIVGRDHAGPGPDASGKPFYEPYAAHAAVSRFRQELGIEVLRFRDFLYLPDQDSYAPEDQVPPGAKTLNLSGTELRRRLAEGETVPDGSGTVVLFTGLPASGKSTLARAVAVTLLEEGRGPVTILDADEVRRRHWPELGFSKEDRDENIRRLGRMAADQATGGGVVLCAAIALYDSVRKEARRLVEQVGRFLLVHVATPLAVCEERDPKGLYVKARSGKMSHFTGVSDPYETPGDAEISVASGDLEPREEARKVARLLG